MKFVKRAKRRKAGIYLARTRKHLAMSRENGYVGRSNHTDMRKLCHMGLCRHRTCKAKPWTDLEPRWTRIIPLPWWLSWKWVQAPLEALAITVLLPRYNHSLNLANPRRVPLSVQARQRAERDAMPATYHLKMHAFRTVRTLGWLCIVIGVGMTIWSNVR